MQPHYEFKHPYCVGEYTRYAIVLDIDRLIKYLKTRKELSQRYLNFIHNGTECVKCGKKAIVAYLETNGSNKKHYNLYASTTGIKADMLTLDHIIPVSKGGPSELSNYQILCSACNGKKADTIL